jgi:hypothetical protein
LTYEGVTHVQGCEDRQDETEANRVQDRVPGAEETRREFSRREERDTRERRPYRGLLQRQNFVRV